MKQFFKMVFAPALSTMLATGIITTVLIFMTIGYIATTDSTPDHTPRNNTVFKIKPDGTLVDNPAENPSSILMGGKGNILSLGDLPKTIQITKQNDKIAGIHIELGLLSSGSTSLEAIRRPLADFKESGKFVVAYTDDFTRGNYFLCSVAGKVFLNPQGILELTGLASQTLFYKGLMDKVGIEMQISKVGIHRGTVEPFMLDKLNEVNREQIQSYISTIWDNITEGIAGSRGISVDDINHYVNEGFLSADPVKMVERGLIDELKYKPEVEIYVKELIEQNGEELRSASLTQMKTLKASSTKNAPEIAVLYIEGETKVQAPDNLYDIEQSTTEKMAGGLIKLKNNDDAKAVAFRVNPPGGSAYTSKQMQRQVAELKKVRPVVISMGNVAASGGYYTSCVVNKVTAEPNILTDSTGTFGMFPNASGSFGKLALTTGIVKTDTFLDLGDLSRLMTEDEKVLIQGYVERGYQASPSRCTEGRGMITEAVNAIGQGRVWTGKQAKERGLADEPGGIELTISTAAGLANLDQYSITTVNGSKNFLDEFLESQFGEVGSSVVRGVLDNEFEYFKTLNSTKSNCGIQVRMPYDTKPL